MPAGDGLPALPRGGRRSERPVAGAAAPGHRRPHRCWRWSHAQSTWPGRTRRADDPQRGGHGDCLRPGRGRRRAAWACQSRPAGRPSAWPIARQRPDRRRGDRPRPAGKPIGDLALRPGGRARLVGPPRPYAAQRSSRSAPRPPSTAAARRSRPRSGIAAPARRSARPGRRRLARPLDPAGRRGARCRATASSVQLAADGSFHAIVADRAPPGGGAVDHDRRSPGPGTWSRPGSTPGSRPTLRAERDRDVDRAWPGSRPTTRSATRCRPARPAPCAWPGSSGSATTGDAGRSRRRPRAGLRCRRRAAARRRRARVIRAAAGPGRRWRPRRLRAAAAGASRPSPGRSTPTAVAGPAGADGSLVVLAGTVGAMSLVAAEPDRPVAAWLPVEAAGLAGDAAWLSSWRLARSS